MAHFLKAILREGGCRDGGGNGLILSWGSSEKPTVLGGERGAPGEIGSVIFGGGKVKSLKKAHALLRGRPADFWIREWVDEKKC